MPKRTKRPTALVEYEHDGVSYGEAVPVVVVEAIEARVEREIAEKYQLVPKELWPAMEWVIQTAMNAQPDPNDRSLFDAVCKYKDARDRYVNEQRYGTTIADAILRGEYRKEDTNG